MALPSSILPSTTAEVLAEQDALKASINFRRLPANELPSFLVTLAASIANDPIDPKKLYARNIAVRQTYYSHIIKVSKKESSLLLLAIKYDKLDKLNTPTSRSEYIDRLSHLIMIFMGKYNFILKDVPKTDIIANKLGKDVYFHIVKRLPSLVTLINNPDNTESIKAFNDALYYIKSSVMHPLTRFISLLLGELASSGTRPDIDKREFKREQKADKAALKEDFRKNRKFYKYKWSALRNEASATLSNLDIEASVSSNSSKTRDILNERRARIDNFIYSLEQGIQAVNNNSFEGFVSAKVAIEDSLIEYSKRLEFRTLAKKSRDIDAAFNLKNNPKQRRSTKTNLFSFGRRPKDPTKTGSNSGRYVHGVLKHLGPAGLALYAGYKLINNPITRTLVGRPLRYLGVKALQGAGYVASAAGRKFAESVGDLSRAAFSLVGRGLPIMGAAMLRGARYSSRKLGSLSSRLITKLRSSGSGPSLGSKLGGLTSKALYNTGYGVGAAVKSTRKGAGLLSSLVKNSFSPTSLATTSRTDPDMSGIMLPPATTQVPTQVPIPATQTRPANSISSSQPSIPSSTTSGKFPLELISRDTRLPIMKSGLSSPRAELFIDDILERIDEHVPYIPADLVEQDFSLSDLKEVVTDALEEFLTNMAVPSKDMLSTTVKPESQPLVSAALGADMLGTTNSTGSSPDMVLNTLTVDRVDAKNLDLLKDTRLSELVQTNSELQHQLEALDRQLDKLLARKSSVNPYDYSLVEDLKNSVIETTKRIETKVVSSTKTLVTSLTTKLASTEKTEDEALKQETAEREDRADRYKLVRAVERLSRSKSRSAQSGGINLGALAGSLLSSPLAAKAIKIIESVLGSSAGKVLKSSLPSLLKYAPRLASFALPAITLAGTAYAGWELGTKLYEEYSTDILDAVDSVIETATNIVQGLKDGYDYVVGLLKTPAEKLKTAGTKLSNWWDTNPISRGTQYVSKGASRAASIVSEKVGQVGSAVSSVVSNAVDSVSTAASGAKTYVSSTVGKLFSTNKSTVDFDNMDPVVKSSFENMAKEYREMGGAKPLNIESARRTTEQQAKLYEANPSLAAKPGRSLHERGRALDIDRATAGELESMGLLSKYGFSRNVKGEPWHLSYVGQNSSSIPASALPIEPSTKTQVQSSPTSTKPSYEQPKPTAPSTNSQASPRSMSSNKPSTAAINTFSFIDNSFFIMNAGMMAS